MLVLYKWLKEYVEKCPTPTKLMEELSLHSVEVEGIRTVVAVSTTPAAELGNVVVAEVLNIKKHPNADKLNIGLFDVGEAQSRQIIFGGVARLKVGDKLPVALAPTRIKAGKITKQKLRGEVSEGMCCLNSELGILNQRNEVHFFDSSVANGTLVATTLATKKSGRGVNSASPDMVLEIDNKSMTHRADFFCHTGIAREVAAVFRTKFLYPKLPALPRRLPKLNVSVKNYDDCPRYMAVAMEVRMGEAPEFMRERLQALGVKSINNVVDITNYVMLELGEPLHAFDASNIGGNKIIVRRAKKGEKLLTLDHENKELTEDVLVIADDHKPIAIAGVIGGQHSAVTESTNKIILEAANFAPLIVRESAKKVGLRTEAAIRWEKGLSPELAAVGVRRAIEMLQKYAGAKIVGYVDQYPHQQRATSIKLRAEFLERLTGSSALHASVPKLLKLLECAVQVLPKKVGWKVTPPWFRHDLRCEEDLVEELVRLYGVSRIPKQQLTAILQPSQPDLELQTMFDARRALAAAGFSEVYNYSFNGPQLLQKIGWNATPDHVEILNPLNDDARYLRVSLLPRLLENITKNQVIKKDLRFFEISHVYTPNCEARQLAIVITGERDLYRLLRGEVETLLKSWHVNWRANVVNQTALCQFWNLYDHAQALRIDVSAPNSKSSQILGTLGLVQPTVLKQFHIKNPVAFAMLSIQVLSNARQHTFTLKPISAFPVIPLDLALVVKEDILWQDLEQVILAAGEHLIGELEVFDIYRGSAIPIGTKSIAIHLLLQSHKRTLQMSEIEAWRTKLMQKLHHQFGATLRGA